MKLNRLLSILTFVVVLIAIGFGNDVQAQDFAGCAFGPGPGTFVDENGDGFNDLAPDIDGDGIPNGLDDDYVKPADGSGYGPGDETGAGAFGHGQGSGQRFGAGNAGEPQPGFGPGSENCGNTGPAGSTRRGSLNR